MKVLDHYGADLGTIRGYGQWRSIRCPFHEDTTASGRINETLDAFKCMACDVSGDSWKIIKEQEGVNFTEAIRFAIERLGFEGGNVSKPATRRKPYRPSWT